MSDLQPNRLRKIRVLVIGDAGSGKTSLVHLLVNGEPLRQPRRTVGCNVSVKLFEHPEYDHEGVLVKTQPHFVELWDVGTHSQYEKLRNIFYSQMNGVILVHDLSSRRSASNVRKWASEVAAKGSFSAPSQDDEWGYGLPVPALVIGNKMDACDQSSEENANSTFSFLNGLLFGRRTQQTSLLPVQSRGCEQTEAVGGIRASALRGVISTTEVEKFYQELITRRYYSGTTHYEAGRNNGSNSWDRDLGDMDPTPQHTPYDRSNNYASASASGDWGGYSSPYRSISQFGAEENLDIRDNSPPNGGCIRLVIGDDSDSPVAGLRPGSRPQSPDVRPRKLGSFSNGSPGSSTQYIQSQHSGRLHDA